MSTHNSPFSTERVFLLDDFAEEHLALEVSDIHHEEKYRATFLLTSEGDKLDPNGQLINLPAGGAVVLEDSDGQIDVLEPADFKGSYFDAHGDEVKAIDLPRLSYAELEKHGLDESLHLDAASDLGLSLAA